MPERSTSSQHQLQLHLQLPLPIVVVWLSVEVSLVRGQILSGVVFARCDTPDSSWVRLSSAVTIT